MTHFYLALRSLGDSLISLTLLQRLPADLRNVQIVGTAITREVASLLAYRQFPLHAAFDDIPAFYNVRAAGVPRAIRDALVLRRFLANHASRDDVVIGELRDWRSRWLVPARLHSVEPRLTNSVYQDRADLLEGLFGVALPLRTCTGPARPVSSVLVHPGARLPFKVIPPDLLEIVLENCARTGRRVTLIDPDGSYRTQGAKADEYVAFPTLPDAVARLRAADFYVGADSFFMHLAYHYGIPTFALTASMNPYFAPPGLREGSRCCAFAEARANPDYLPQVLAAAMTPSRT